MSYIEILQFIVYWQWPVISRNVQRSCMKSRHSAPCMRGSLKSSECREFNRRTGLLLQRLEDSGFNRLADRTMDLLASCNPKDLSQCDSVQRARDILERLRELARENLENGRG